MKEKLYTFQKKTDAFDGQERTITVIGIFQTEKVLKTERSDALVKLANGKEMKNGQMVFDVPVIERRLTLAYSICHPSDGEFENEQVGISIAKSRAKRYPIGTLYAYEPTMLNEDTCMAVIKNEAEHIANHLEKYINA